MTRIRNTITSGSKGPGTKGYEDAPPVILHGHMDMVCKKELGVSHDFLNDGLDLKIAAWRHKSGGNYPGG